MRSLIGTWLVMTAWALAPGAATHADEPARYDLNIERQPLSRALQAFATQSGVQIIFFSRLTDGYEAPSLSGKFTAASAVSRLLNGTPLTFRELNAKTIEIQSKAGSGGDISGAAAISGGGKSSAVRLAQAYPASTDKTDERKSQPAETAGEDAKGVPELLVKGRRTLNADIQRTQDDVQPYVVFDRAQIERSMANDLTEFFKTRLPMNAVQTSPSQVTSIFGIDGNQSLIDLRGLGPKQTLILVNGRRMPNVSRMGSFNQPDINGIPLAMVERIEVLPSTASGIYGGGATGGVINIITRQDYAGLDMKMTYGNVFDSDAGERRIDLSAGFSLDGGRTEVVVSGSYADANAMLAGDRNFARQARDLQWRNNPAAFLDAVSPPVGYTSNIMSLDGESLQLKPEYGGTVLASSRTFVPVGYAGPATDNALALVRNAGRYNLDLPADLNGSQQSLVNAPTISSASLNLRRSFGARVEAFADVSWLNNEGRVMALSAPNTAEVSADAESNPFTTDVVVSFPTVGLSDPLLTRSTTLHTTGGVIVRLPHRWTAAADYVWSRSEFTWKENSPSVDDPDTYFGPGLTVLDAFYYGELDVMRDVNRYQPDYSPYRLQWPSLSVGPSTTVLRDLNLRLSGPALDLPGGPLALSALISRRRAEGLDDFQDFFDPYDPSGFGTYYFPHRQQAVDSYYAEARIPLVSDANARSGVRALEFQVSGRHDSYRTTAPLPGSSYALTHAGPFEYEQTKSGSSATKYTLGVRYAPAQDIALRMSFGTGFLPPSVDEIGFDSITYLRPTLVDPKRGGVAARLGLITRTYGGSPDLVAEDSESFSAGMILTPRFAPGLRLSVDYTRIRKKNDITLLSLQQILDLEDQFPGKVTRAPLTQADRDRGYTGGIITSLDQTLVNLTATQLEAYDMQADYTLQAGAGTLRLHAIATWQPAFERKAQPGAPFVNSSGFSGGPLEWRGTVGASWEQGPWTLDWTAQYLNSYRAYSATVADETVAAIRLNQGSDFISSQTYHDVYARYRFDTASAVAGGLLENMELSVGIQNLFDKTPPILATTSPTGGYSTYGDPRLRRYTIGLRKRF